MRNKLLREAMIYADAVYLDRRVHPIARAKANASNVYGFGSDIAIIEGNCVAIRGSDDREDWISNFRFLPNSLGEHRDFARVAEKFLPIFEKRAAEAAELGEYLRIYGHSRGGGIAILLAALLARLDYPTLCVTFGAPPSFTHEGAENLMSLKERPMIYRVVTRLDPVPKMTFGIGVHPVPAIIVKPPLWMSLIPFGRRILHHRRRAYWHGVFND